MSTTYYALRHPVAELVPWLARPTVCDMYRLGPADERVWIGCVDAPALHLVADRDVKVAHRSGGAIAVYATGPDDMQAISEYGEIVTLGQLRRGEAP